MNSLVLVVLVLGTAVYTARAGVIDPGYGAADAGHDGGAALQLAAGATHGLADAGTSGGGGGGSGGGDDAQAHLQLVAAVTAGHGLDGAAGGHLQLQNTVQLGGDHSYVLNGGTGDLGAGHDFSPKVEHHHVPVQTIVQTKPVPVEVVKKIGVPVPHPVPVHVPHVIKVPVPHPYAVHINVPHPVPVPIYKIVPKEIEKKVPIPVEKIVPYPVEKPFKVEVAKPIPVPVPVYKNIYHHAPKHSKWA